MPSAPSHDLRVLTSPAIMQEAAKVLRVKGGWQEAQIVSYLKLLDRIAEIIAPRLTLRVILEDEADNRILECALAGNAHLIVSGDYHLRRLKAFRGIGIVRPIDLQRTLG